MKHDEDGIAESGAQLSSQGILWRAIPVLALTLVAMACSSVTVNTDFDRGADFSRYQTYSWRQGTPARNQLMDRRIVAAVDNQLRSKGLMRVDSGAGPNLFVTYHAAVRQELDIQTVDYGRPYRCFGGCARTTTVRPVDVGTLVVDLVDTRGNTLVWRGMASDAISSDPEETTKKINEGVDKMFENYPPRT